MRGALSLAMSKPMVTEPTQGQTLGRYQLLMNVAQGGMARVWVARLHGSRGFRKLVAVKTILPGPNFDGEKLDRMLLEEANLAASIHHPNVGTTFELGEQHGVLYLVMEWIDGEGLHTVIRQSRGAGGIPLLAAVNIVGQACKGLHAAHEQTDDLGTPLGIVHRDVSPHNILVTYSGVAKLVDFGVAEATQRSQDAEKAGQLKGKLAYLAPEVVRGNQPDRRADLFSLGAVLYLATTGRHPFKEDSATDTLRKICDPRPVMPPSALIKGYPRRLEAVVTKALHKKPENRFSTAREMLDALEAAVPAAFEPQADTQLAEFMRRVSGERGVQRRERIAEAITRIDIDNALRFPDASAEGTSQGSLRAITVDSVDDVRPDGVAVEDYPTLAEEAAKQPRAKRRLLVASVSVAAVAVAVAIGLTALSPSQPGPAAAPATPSPVEKAPRETATARAVPTVEETPPVPAGSGTATVEPVQEESAQASADSQQTESEPEPPRAGPRSKPNVPARPALRLNKPRPPKSTAELKDPYATPQ